MKTKSFIHKLAAVLTIAALFLFTAVIPMTAYAAPEESTAATSSPAAESSAPAENEAPAENNNTPVVPDGATPPYNAVGNILTNDRYHDEETGKQFVIFKTESGKVFYLMIDHDKGTDNVYLLTEVGEDDLLNFVEVDANGNPVTPPSGNSGNTQEKPGAQTETPAQNNTTGLIVIAIAVVGIGGAAFYFFKSKKSGNKPLKAADFDFEDDEDEDDEPTVNEDEQEDED
jgi:hypothetical protein